MKLKMSMPNNLASLIAKAFFILAGVFLAFLFGLLATTANPIMIVLALGLVGGVFLLAMPKLSIELLISVGLMMGALVSLVGSVFGKLPWAMAMLGALLLIPSFIQMIGRNRPTLPAFIWIAIIFMVYALLSSLMNWDSFAEFVAGFKRYFQVFGLLLALSILPFLKKDFIRWQYIVLIIGFLQLPFALYELLILVPERGGIDTASFATDVVAGTFGANLEGGSPNVVMVVYLLLIFSFVFSRWRSGLISTRNMVIAAILLLMPLGMGETKIAVVMVPMLWFVLIRHDMIRAPVKYLPVIGTGIFLTLILLYIYVVLIMKSTVGDVLESTISYNFADAGYGNLYLNRTTALSFWFDQQGLNNPFGFFFGNGLGSSFIGQISGHVGLKYPGFGINLTAASSLLWDLGIFGLVLFIGIFISAWHTANKLYKSTEDKQVKADLLAIQASLSLFILLLSYSQDMVNLIGLEIMYSLVLGYLAFLYKSQQRILIKSNP